MKEEEQSEKVDRMSDPTPTPEAIRKLSQEAAEAGDLAMVETCAEALAGEEAALERVAEVLSDARAQEVSLPGDQEKADGL